MTEVSRDLRDGSTALTSQTIGICFLRGASHNRVQMRHSNSLRKRKEKNLRWTPDRRKLFDTPEFLRRGDTSPCYGGFIPKDHMKSKKIRWNMCFCCERFSRGQNLDIMMTIQRGGSQMVDFSHSLYRCKDPVDLRSRKSWRCFNAWRSAGEMRSFSGIYDQAGSHKKFCVFDRDRREKDWPRDFL